ncbi:MAG TPA: peptidylprolyl isomerase [Desulfitobacteriaceae bacterium]|nr:peptidylprolyl isomerase [Desulfitobacteriaceae bacterium]
MKKFQVGMVLIVFIVMLTVTGCNSLAGSEWVAKVNGEAISLDQYNVRLNDVKQIYEQQGMDFTTEQGKEGLTQLKNQMLQRLIDSTLFTQDVKKLGLKTDDPLVKTEEENIRNNIGSEEKFQEVLKQQGMTETELLNYLALYLHQTADITLSDSEIKTYYDSNQEKYNEQEQVKASHILVQTEEEAKQIIAELNAGGDFAQLAKDKSTDTGSKDSGGDLGYFSKGQMVTAFETAAFAQTVGTYSAEPVKTDYGYHIIYVVDHKQPKVYSYDEIKDKVAQDALKQAKDDKFQSYYDELRKNAQLEYAAGYNPETPITTEAG